MCIRDRLGVFGLGRFDSAANPCVKNLYQLRLQDIYIYACYLELDKPIDLSIPRQVVYTDYLITKAANLKSSNDNSVVSASGSLTLNTPVSTHTIIITGYYEHAGTSGHVPGGVRQQDLINAMTTNIAIKKHGAKHSIEDSQKSTSIKKWDLSLIHISEPTRPY